MSGPTTYFFPVGTLIQYDGFSVVVEGFSRDGLIVRDEYRIGKSPQNVLIEHSKVREIMGRIDTVVDQNYRSDTPDDAVLAAAERSAVLVWADATESEQEEALMKEAWVLACQKYIRDQRFTETAIRKKWGEIKAEAIRRLELLCKGKAKGGSFKAKSWGPKRISQFCKLYFDQLLPTADVLLNKKNKGNTQRRVLTREECDLLNQTCKKYRSKAQPSKTSIERQVLKAFRDASAQKMAKGLPPLSVPHRNTIYRRLAAISKTDQILGREGLQEAMKQLSPTEHGIRALKPGELIELDFQHVDVFTLREKSQFWGLLSPDLQAKLEEKELNKKRKKKVQRLWVCAAIDVATRMILGVGLAETANVRTVIEVLDMVTRSKANISQLAGCSSTWHQATGLGTIVVDTGNEFFNKEIQAAILSLGGSYIYGRTGVPMDKPFIERFFGTLRTMFADELPGKTGYSPDCLIDYKKEEMAAFNAAVFRELLIRFVVDFYPMQKHKGLMGKRPIDQWKQAAKYGAVPAPTVRVRRAATGLKLKRKLAKEGICILGVPFGDMKQLPKKAWGEKVDLEIRLDQTDMREVTAYYEGEHYFLKNKRPDLAHHSVRTLMQAIEEMTRPNPKDREYYEYTLAKYADELDLKIQNGIEQHGLPSMELREETLEWFENSFCMNLQIKANPEETFSANMETLLAGGTGRGITTPEMIEDEKSEWAEQETSDPSIDSTQASREIEACSGGLNDEVERSNRIGHSAKKARRKKANQQPEKSKGRKFAGAPKGKGSFK